MENEAIRDLIGSIKNLMSNYVSKPGELRELINKFDQEKGAVKDFLVLVRHPTLYNRPLLSTIYVIMQMLLAALFFVTGLFLIIPSYGGSTLQSVLNEIVNLLVFIKLEVVSVIVFFVGLAFLTLSFISLRNASEVLEFLGLTSSKGENHREERN